MRPSGVPCLVVVVVRLVLDGQVQANGIGEVHLRVQALGEQLETLEAPVWGRVLFGTEFRSREQKGSLSKPNGRSSSA